MSSYIGRHAELYDLFYADKPYREEAAFVDHCLQKYGAGGRRVLELACGTGRHAFELEKIGYQVTAVDYSADMLKRARENSSLNASQVVFQQQDMTALSLGEGRFDAAVCLFDSIGYVASDGRVAKVLAGVHRHVRAGGLFVFEFWHAAAMLSSYEPVRVRRWNTADGQVLRISETHLDQKTNLAQVTYSVYELRADGTYAAFSETQTNRCFVIPEMADFLSSAGFTPLKWFAGFSEADDISDQTWHIVAIARNN